MNVKYEVLGMLGSLFIVLAFSSKGEKNIRRMDAIGAVLHIIYAILIHSPSNIFLNTVLLCVNVYNLIKLSHASK